MCGHDGFSLAQMTMVSSFDGELMQNGEARV
jgi:hypothetical protein